MTITALSESEFDGFIAQSTEAVLLDFWSPACGTCLLMAPTLERLSEEQVFPARFAKIDAMANPELALRFGVRTLPTILILDAGVVTHRLVGLMSRNKLIAALTGTLGGTH